MVSARMVVPVMAVRARESFMVLFGIRAGLPREAGKGLGFLLCLHGLVPQKRGGCWHLTDQRGMGLVSSARLSSDI